MLNSERVPSPGTADTTFGPLHLYGIHEPVVTHKAANDNKPHGSANYIATYTSRFYPTAPRASEVDILDIAHSLGMQCRYAGHGRRFYSVAEHSVHIARYLQRTAPRAALAGLLHDATEAYVVDVPRPVKSDLAGYKEIERRVWYAIAAAFGLSPVIPDEVHEADSRIIADEMSQNLHETDPNYDNPLGVRLEFWTPETAKRQFLMKFDELMAERRVAA